MYTHVALPSLVHPRLLDVLHAWAECHPAVLYITPFAALAYLLSLQNLGCMTFATLACRRTISIRGLMTKRWAQWRPAMGSWATLKTPAA